MVTDNHQYKTTETSLATYLIGEGFIPLKIDYSNPRYEFIFSNEDSKVQEHANLYITGKARVDPATFTRINRKLIRLLKNGLQWEDE